MVSDLILSGTAHCPPFNQNKIPPVLLDKFVKREEIFQTAKRFLLDIQEAWQMAYPDQEKIEFFLPPGFSENSLSQSLTEREPYPLTNNNTQGIGASFAKNVAIYSQASLPKTKVKPLSDKSMETVADIQNSSPDDKSVPTDPMANTAIDSGNIPAIPKTVVPGNMALVGSKKNIADVSVATKEKGKTAAILADLQATFIVTNAMSGKPYRAKIEGKNASGQPLDVVSAKAPQKTGLAFDPTTRELHGIPNQAGDHQIDLQWSYSNGSKRTGYCILTVNANPQDLWKNIEPDPNAPYFKNNVDSKFIKSDGFQMVAASKRGRSHAHVGSFRDDAFFLAHDPSGWCVLIVADGAGSAKYSRQGAELAANTVGKYLLTSGLAGKTGTDMLDYIKSWETDPDGGAKPLKDQLYYLFGKAITEAVKVIDVEAQKKQAAFKDYSTTLLVSICRWEPDGIFLASFWLGDGAICAYDKDSGNTILMGSPDSGDFAGQTSFLDKSTVSEAATAIWDRIQFKRFDKLTTLILMTDGVSDPRFETDSGLANSAKWDALWEELTPVFYDSEPDKKLVDWLDFFATGHHDDRTIAILW